MGGPGGEPRGRAAGLKMANYWLVKTEPSTYSYDDLEREKTAVWDGVKNPVALRNLKSMHPGDQVLVYHTGDEKAVVGWATVVSAPYTDPKQKDAKLVVIDLRAHRRLPQAVTLAQIKADRTFVDLPIVRQGRLSVSPVTAPQWKRVLQLAGAED
jgi:predicted RNA-binding protein with PUA-like domain